jgi:hypothetical protein
METITPERQQQVDALLFSGKKIHAIKLYRQWADVGLKEAKYAVDAREKELRQQSPQSFSSQPSGCFGMVLLAIGIGILVISAVFSAAWCRAQASTEPAPSPSTQSAKSTPELLVGEIGRILPPGWRVERVPKDDRIVMVTRSEPAMMAGGINTDVNGSPRLEQYSFELYVREFITPPQYSAMETENRQTEARLEAMYEGMQDIPHKFDAFLPSTPEQQQQVAAYNALKQKLHRLPDFHYHDVSLDVRADDYRGATSQEVADECNKVRRQVYSLLMPYRQRPAGDDRKGR